jgi:hypothetical protein
MDRKLLWGIIVIIVSLLLGLLFKFVVFVRLVGSSKFHWLDLQVYWNDPWLRFFAIIYILSWPMLFFGIYLCGKQGYKYAERFTRYLTYRYYHRQAARHVPKLAKKARKQTQRILRRSRRQLEKGGWILDEKHRRASARRRSTRR